MTLHFKIILAIICVNYIYLSIDTLFILRRKLLELQQGNPQPLNESLQAPRRGQGDGAASSEMQNRYDEVLAENETLRSGMYEILEKLREYDGEWGGL